MFEVAAGRVRFYWDSAPLIAWFTGEKRSPSEAAGLAAVMQAVDAGRAEVMTSVLWRVEVLELGMTAAQRDSVRGAFDSQALIELACDSKVLDLAGEIRLRQRANKAKAVLKNIRTPDAIHLASAIMYEAAEFHTFDGARNDGAAAGLLSLSGNVAGHKLRICVPNADQYMLDFDSPSDADQDDARPGE